MALVLKDRVKETSVSTGTGAFSLAGAVGAYQTFSTIGNGNTTYYCIAGQTTNQWEVGIGTYTSSTDSISRDVILASSNSNTIVTFSAGTKDVFITYPSEKGVWVDASGTSNYAATIGSTAVNLGATVSTLAGLTSVTVTQDPSVALDLATKQYVDTLVSSGITYHAAVKYEVPDSTGNLTATYNNGTAGVGATLTNAGTQTAFTPDGIVATAGDRVLIYNQTSAFQNGVYEVTTVGSGATNWVLTRTTDTDSYGLKDPNALGNGDAFFVASGNTGAGETYVCNTVGVITFGTTAITFQQISASQVYNAGTGLTLSPATTFNIANTAVTAASYGAASKTLTATVNAQGQLTALADTNIAIAMSQVTSGTLGATQGGTDNSSYAVGDLLYANTTTSLAKLADVATGNALISGGVSTAPSWGKIGLTTHISGTLGIANGGTNATSTPTAGGVAYGTGTAYAVNTAGTSGQYLTSGGAGAPTWVTLPTNVASISFGSTGLTPATATTGAVTVAGTLAVANGGTGTTTAQAAMNTFAGATTSGQYLRGNGTNVVMASIVAGDVPTLNQNTTGSSGSCTGNAATATSAGSITGYGNPTTAPTANTIVYRDGSGDISAREIVLSSGLSAVTPTVLVSMYPTTNQMVRTTPGAVAASLSGQTMNIAGSSTSCSGNAATATYASTAGRAYPYRVGGVDLNFNWYGQSGQPPWLWGGSDGSNMYVYNPSNFSVNYANTAGSAPANGGTSAACSGNAATATALSTASGSAPSYAARAWVNWNGTGTVAIRASGNVSSITDNGTGSYTVNFTTAMSDANYAVSVAAQGINTGNLVAPMGTYGTNTGGAQLVAPTTAGYRISTWASNLSGQGDVAYVMSTTFR
jgi:hypothetical protein